MNTYKLNLNEYDISPKLYKELEYFSLQYGEKMQKLRADSTPPEYAAQLRHDVDIIESALIKASDPVNREALRKSVTDKMPYKNLQVYCGQNQFYHMRREYFHQLAISLNRIPA